MSGTNTMDASPGLNPVRHTIPGEGGVPINAWDHGGSGPALVLCHCTGTHSRIWDPLVPELMRHFHVYATDTRGHGDSGRPTDFDDFRWANSGRDLLAVIDALGLGHGILATGHSGGAAHVAYAEWFRPGTFSRAVLIDAIIGPPEIFEGRVNPLEKLARHRRNDFDSRAAARERYASKPPMNTWHPACLDAYVNHAFADRPDGGVTLKCQGPIEAEVYKRSGSTDVFGHLKEFAMEPFLITADQSNVRYLPELQRAQLPNARFHEFEGVTHFIPQERPVEVAQLVTEFLTA